MPGKKKKNTDVCDIHKEHRRQAHWFCSWRKDRFKGEVTDSRKIYNSVELSKSMTATLDDIREVQERMWCNCSKWEMSGVTRIMDWWRRWSLQVVKQLWSWNSWFLEKKISMEKECSLLWNSQTQRNSDISSLS